MFPLVVLLYITSTSSMGYFNRNISIKTLIRFHYFEIVLINNLTYKRFVYHINTCYPTSQ